ncbi:hypothetical protein V5O48_001771 [Marasmius crinis-equi]|uniref:Trafficking protein particle complex subunit 10 n=1 Tax=Marasmius crinis-equi TaxID=585013 RepID=A0ABR3FXJ1_9AGAR
MTLLEKPFLNVYIVSCENTDLEGYRTTVKKQIKDWHTIVSSRKNQEWLILHVVRPDSKAPSGNFLKLKGSVFDKIRADFNSDKRERLESLARSFEGVKLFDDALLQYDELEEFFHQVLKDKNFSWFGPFITPDPKDDSAPLLSVSKKAYRDLILANTISVFDLRIYLLARQCELFAHSGRILEVCTKVGSFLGAFGRRLREVEATLPPFFVESWIYSSALSVVEQCDVWVSDLALDPSISPYNAGKAELIQLARNQARIKSAYLDIIGIGLGHLPTKPPFSSVLASVGNHTPSSGKISNAQLLRTFADKEEFYELYITITTRAIDLYAKAGRRKFALKLHGSIAALDIHRGRLDTAFTTYSSLPAHYALHLWTSLESSSLRHALDTHAALDKPRDREWIHILLSFMKTYAETSGAELLMAAEDRVTYISHLIEQMKTAAAELQEDLHHPDHPAFVIEVASLAELAGEKDGSYLEATVSNRLPCPLSVTDIRVVLTGQDSEKLEYGFGPYELAPGKSRLRLFCPSPSTGTFAFDSSEIRLGRLLLQWTHRKTTSSRGSMMPRRPILVKIPRDPEAFEVQIVPPTEVQLDGTPRLLLKVSSGRNKITKASVKMSSSSIRFQLQGAKNISEKAGVIFEVSSDYLTWQHIPEHEHVEVLLPHTHAGGNQAIKILAEAEYVAERESDISRSLRTSTTVSISLPISVNVEDFFRGKRLFSKFTVSTANHQHVRISDARLEISPGLESGVTVANCTSRRPIYTVKRTRPVDFVFQINSSDGPVREPLTLCVRYRMLREEVEAVITAAVDQHQQASLESDRETIVQSLLKSLELNSTWVDLYEITGELHFPAGDDSEGVGLDHLEEPIQQIKEIVASVNLKIAPEVLQDAKPIYAGQPIPATITIHTSFHWGTSHGDPNRQYAMQYDVEEMVREWLVSGRKRGNFVAMDNHSFTVPITLVALHHGEYALPQVTISALPLADEITMGSMAIPSTETYQIHGAETVMILPRGGRSTYVVGMSGG